MPRGRLRPIESLKWVQVQVVRGSLLRYWALLVVVRDSEGGGRVIVSEEGREFVLI